MHGSFQEFAGEPFDNLIAPRIQEALKEVTATYSAEMIVKKREEVKAHAVELARRKIGTNFLEVADLEYNLDTLEVRRGGKLLQLNPTALKILQSLMEASPAVVPRTDLETRVWGEELPDSDSLRVHIHGLRAAVDKPFDKALIQTRHGIGYRIADSDPA